MQVKSNVLVASQLYSARLSGAVGYIFEVEEILAMAQERVRAAGGSLAVIASAENSCLMIEHESSKEGQKMAPLHPKMTPPRSLKLEERESSAIAQRSSCPQEVVISHPERKAFEGLEADGMEVVRVNATLLAWRMFSNEKLP